MFEETKMSDEKKSIYVNTYALIKKSCSLVGLGTLSPKTGFRNFVKTYQYLMFQYCLLSTVVCTEFFFLVEKIIALESMPLIIECMACFITCCLSLLKATMMAIHSDKVCKLYTELYKMWPEEPHPKRINTFVDGPFFILKYLMRCIHVSYMMLVQAFHVLPIALNLKNYIFGGGPFSFELPYSTYYPFEVDNYPLYIVMYILHINAGTWVALAFAAADSFLYFCITNLGIQFELLATDITYIVETHHHKMTGTLDSEMDFRNRDPNAPQSGYPYDEDSYNVDDMDGLYESLKSCIKRHTFLIELVADLDEIFGLTILANIVSSSLLICLTGFLIINSKNFTIDMMVEHSISVPTKILQILLLCWNGDQIISTSGKVADAAVSSKWYYTDRKFKIALILLTLRAQRPVSLNAMGFSVVSLLTFTSVIGTSWSYLTLLRTTLE